MTATALDSAIFRDIFSTPQMRQVFSDEARTGYAWSQAPKSRTVRMISNVEVFATRESGARMVRSNFLIGEFRVDGTRYLAGWCGHRFVQSKDRWEIKVRQVNLIDCDQNLRNPSIVL